METLLPSTNNDATNKKIDDPTTGRDSDDESLEWDDDDYKAPEIKLLPSSAAENLLGTDGDCEKGCQIANDDDWLAARSLDTSMKFKKASAVYLTKQFERLSTPGSSKKSRCAICTRPLDGASLKYCTKHTKHVGEEKKDNVTLR